MNKEVTQLVRQIRDEIVANYYRMRLNATGRFDRETEVVEYAGGVKIESPAYIYQMEDGRAAGSFPPVSAIKQCYQARWYSCTQRTQRGRRSKFDSNPRDGATYHSRGVPDSKG